MDKQMLESFGKICKNTLPQKKKLVESVGKFIIMHKSGKLFWNDNRAKFVKNLDDASIFQLSQEAEDALFNAKELYLDKYPEARNSDNIIITAYDDAFSIIDKSAHYAKGKNQSGDKKEEYQKVFDKFNISGAYPGKLEYEFDGKDGHYKTYGLKGTNNTGSRGWTDTVNFILRVTEPSGKYVFIGTAKELDEYLMDKVAGSSSTAALKEWWTEEDKEAYMDSSEFIYDAAESLGYIDFAFEDSIQNGEGMTQFWATIQGVPMYAECDYSKTQVDNIESAKALLDSLDWTRGDIDESVNIKKQNSFKQLRESLSGVKYLKMQRLIRECLKEGMQVEITIPRNRKALTEATETESFIDILDKLSSSRKPRNIIIPHADHNVSKEVLHWIKTNGKSVKVFNAGDIVEKSPSADVLLINDIDLAHTRNAYETYLNYDNAGKQVIYLVNTHEVEPSIATEFAIAER